MCRPWREKKERDFFFFAFVSIVGVKFNILQYILDNKYEVCLVKEIFAGRVIILMIQADLRKCLINYQALALDKLIKLIII